MQKISSFLSVIILFMSSAPQLKAQNLDKEIKEIVEPLVASISNQPVKNVAISDFTLLDGTPTELGKYLAEEFSLSLINAKKSFVVIDRSRVTALLKENNLGGSGLIDPNTIAKLGKIQGIDALIAGTMTSTGNTIRLIVKVWNLETQGLVAGNKGDISKTPFIMELEGKVVSGGASSVITAATTIPTKTEVNQKQCDFQNAPYQIDGENYRVTFCNCYYKNNKVTCPLWVYNTGDQVLHNFCIHLGKNARVTLDYGKTYSLTTATILGKSASTSQFLYGDIPASKNGVPAFLSFEGIETNSKSIESLEMTFSSSGKSAGGTKSFPNVPLIHGVLPQRQ